MAKRSYSNVKRLRLPAQGTHTVSALPSGVCTRGTRQSVRFKRTYANVPVCCPAHAILLTGTYPHVNGMIANDLRLRLGESQPRQGPMIFSISRCTFALLSAAFIAALSLPGPRAVAAEQGKPNILWITCEDTSPHLGCYGDAFARTPNLDALARQGVRYTRAFAYTGVCAPSRSCLITGVYPVRLGSQHMRSTTRLPEAVKCFPEYLRAAGYYCANNSKEDYNFATPPTAWDESSPKAHWRKRTPGQPFFSVFNFTVCHQSQIFCDEKGYEQNTRRLTPEQRHDPGKVTVPPFHPDTPEFRKEWARHYDNVTAMDYLAGDVLAELEKDGLAEETIVFFFSDHGTGMPGVKMFAWGPSLQVPLLIRFPKKWQHRAPAPAGGTTDRLVSFVDFAPTMLGLAGMTIPEAMQGVAFLGEKSGEPRELIFGGKDRQGECADTIRYVRDARFQCNRNFHPELPFGQFMSYAWQHASMRAWEQLHREGKLSGPPARFFAPRKADRGALRRGARSVAGEQSCRGPSACRRARAAARRVGGADESRGRSRPAAGTRDALARRRRDAVESRRRWPVEPDR